MSSSPSMDQRCQIVRIADAPVSAAPGFNRIEGAQSLVETYALSERLALPAEATTFDRGDVAALVAALRAIAAKYAEFHRSVAPCVLTSGVGDDAGAASSKTSLPRTGGASRSPSANVESLSSQSVKQQRKGFAGKSAAAVKAVAAPPSAALITPDLESFWSATSPLPPTAVLASLHALLPLHHASEVYNNYEDGANNASDAAETVDGKHCDYNAAQRDSSSDTCKVVWTLCRSTKQSTSEGQRRFSFWEGFAMAAVAAHTAVAELALQGRKKAFTDTPSSPASASSASSFSLAEQLRRADAVLGTGDQRSAATTFSSKAKPTAHTAAFTLLEWPEEFLWNLLISLLSVVALVHRSGFHFFGQLRAADVLCISCASSLPRQLEQTWQDVLAAVAAKAPRQSVTDTEKEDDVALFRTFYTTASTNVLLPQATLSPETPCHNAFFVVHPTCDLLRRPHEQQVTTDMAALPGEQLRYQAADLASIGCIAASIMDMRSRWTHRSNEQQTSTWNGTAAPSSELVFLVRRLCECAKAVDAAAPPPQASRAGPTALQLLQLHAMRLRTEAWYYRRLAEEACDRLTQVPLPQKEQRPPSQEGPVARKEGMGEPGKTYAAPFDDLHQREAAVTEREAKLDLLLQVYELTHEHLDGFNMPQASASANGSDTRGNIGHSRRDSTENGQPWESTARSTPLEGISLNELDLHEQSVPQTDVSREDSLDRLLTSTSLTQPTANATAPRKPEPTPAPAAAAAATPRSMLVMPQRNSRDRHTFPTYTAADISGGALLLGLSPLPQASEVGEADAPTHRTAGYVSTETRGIFPAQRGVLDARHVTAVPDTHPRPRSVPPTHRHLNVGDSLKRHDEVTEMACGSVQSPSSPPPPQPLLWSARNTAAAASQQGMLRSNPSTAINASVTLDELVHASANVPAVHFSAQTHLPRATQEMARPPLQQQQQHQSFLKLSNRDVIRNAAQDAAPYTVVEVELNDDDDDDTSIAENNTKHLLKHVPSAPLFSSASPAMNATGIQMQTPVRAPAIPSMGVVDTPHQMLQAPSHSGPGAGGGNTSSHSKYSSLALLRTPPSARRPRGSVEKRNSPMVSRSPEEQRVPSSATYTTPAGAGAASAVGAMTKDPPLSQRPARRRSVSRGSPHPDRRAGHDAASAANATVADATAETPTDGTQWARHQLTELQNMQTALRAQQPATPRSRAAAAAAVGTAATANVPPSTAVSAVLKTPEMRRSRSRGTPSPSYSTPHGASPTSASAHATPTRHSGYATDQSPSHTHGSHRGRDAERHEAPTHRNADSSFRAEGKPVQVQGVSWPAAHVQKTPLAARPTAEATRSPSQIFHTGINANARGATTQPRSSSMTVAENWSATMRTPPRPSSSTDGPHSTNKAVRGAADPRRKTSVHPSALTSTSSPSAVARGAYGPAASPTATSTGTVATPAYPSLSGRGPAGDAGGGVNSGTAASLRGSTRPSKAAAMAAPPAVVVTNTVRTSADVSPRRPSAGSTRTGNESARHAALAATGRATVADEGAASLPSQWNGAHRSGDPAVASLSAFSAGVTSMHGSASRGSASTSAMDLLRRLRGSSASTI